MDGKSVRAQVAGDPYHLALSPEEMLDAVTEKSRGLHVGQALAQSLGLPSVAEIPDDENLTPVEQETPQSGQPLDEWLSGIGWPAEVVGCVLAHEVLALPPSAEAEIPDAPDFAEESEA